MKKVYAVSVLAAAAFAVAGMAAPSAQAITVYEKEGFKYTLKGDWQIQLRQDYGKDQDLDVEYDDLEMKNHVSYDLGNGLKAYGELDFGFKNAADKSDSDEAPHLEEAYVGIQVKAGEDGKVKFHFGKDDSAADEFGIEQAYETPLAEDSFDGPGATKGDDLLKLSADFGMVGVIAAYEIEADSEKSKMNGEFFDIFVGAEFAGVNLGFAYQDLEPYGADDSFSVYGVSVAYDAKVVWFGLEYSEAEDRSSLINAAVKAPVGPVKIAAGYQYEDFDADAIEEIGAWYANVTYKFPAAKNVSVFAEIGDTDKDGDDMGYLAGMRIKF
jgi:predicted porin